MEIAFLAADSYIQRKLNFGAAMRRRIYQKLSQMVRNGMPLPKAVETVAAQQAERGRSRATVTAILLRWKRGLLDGREFSEVARPDLPQADLVLLRAGEKSGQLYRAVENIIFLQEAMRTMRKTIAAGVTYPAVLMALAFGIMNLVTYLMVPIYASLVPIDTWTGAAAALADGAWFVANIMPWAVALLLVGLATAIWSLPRWTGPWRLKADRYMPWSTYRLFTGTGFLIALAGLISEGVKSNDALSIIMERANPWYRERIETALHRMEDGENIATALYNSGYDFPDREIVDDLRAYENFDNFDQMIHQLAHDALDTSLDRMKTQMKIIFNVGLFTFAGTLVWYLLGMAGMNSLIAGMSMK
jgi:type II secretory pathway component PulF